MTTTASRFLFPYDPQDASYSILLAWWASLEAEKGERAELRRAENIASVVFNPAYHTLLHRFQEAGYQVGPHYRERLALLAGLAAHVKQHAGNAHFAAQLGKPGPGSDKAPVSELRFRRLLATDDLQELYTQLRRAISLVDGIVNLADLASALFRWRPLAEQNPSDPRKDWAYDYYATAPLV